MLNVYYDYSTIVYTEYVIYSCNYKLCTYRQRQLVYKISCTAKFYVNRNEENRQVSIRIFKQ